MRCKLLILIIFISVVLMASSRSVGNNAKQSGTDLISESNQSNCSINQKATNIASNVADDAISAKDAQPCAMEEASQRAMNQLADRAEQAARSAEVALNGKKLLIELLEQNELEVNGLIDDLNETLARSICNAKTAEKFELDFPQLVESVQHMTEDQAPFVDKIKKLAISAREDMQQKQSMLAEANENLENINKCLQKAQQDLEITEKLSQQADRAAQEAAGRCEAVKKVSEQLMKLQKRDLSSLRRAIKKILKL